MPLTNVETLRNQQLDARHPGFKIGSFLLEHSNSPEYLVGQLEAYLAAAKDDLEAERAMFRRLARRPPFQEGDLVDVTFDGPGLPRRCRVHRQYEEGKYEVVDLERKLAYGVEARKMRLVAAAKAAREDD